MKNSYCLFIKFKILTMLQQNLKYLRRKTGISQQILANSIGVSRTTLGDYERGRTEPDIESLIVMADYFDISIDSLLRKDLKKEDYEIIRNKDFRVLAITIDSENRENIELIGTKAEAGYLESFNDPEYLEDLPKIFFPNIPQGTYRGFEIRGDSMLPMEPGNIVICSYLENLIDIKNDKTYVVVSKSGGIVYKRLKRLDRTSEILLTSDNDVYSPYTLPLEEIAEIWEYYAHVGLSDPKEIVDQMMDEKIIDIQKKVRGIYKKMT